MLLSACSWPAIMAMRKLWIWVVEIRSDGVWWIQVMMFISFSRSALQPPWWWIHWVSSLMSNCLVCIVFNDGAHTGTDSSHQSCHTLIFPYEDWKYVGGWSFGLPYWWDVPNRTSHHKHLSNSLGTCKSDSHWIMVDSQPNRMSRSFW